MMVEPLEFLQALRESELSQLVLIPLLEAMGFYDIRYTHGVLEYGKDIVFFLDHPLQGRQCYAAAVKRTQLDGTVSSNRAIREVFFQIKQTLTEPFTDPFDGSSIRIDCVFVITPCSISQHCIKSISSELQGDGRSVTFIDGPRLLGLLKKHLPLLLSSLPNPETRYFHTLLRRFNDHPSLGRLGVSRSLTFLDIYTGGDLSFTSASEARIISFAAQPPVVERLSIESIIKDHQKCVIVADVGGGKTSLLQRLVAQYAQKATSQGDLLHVPVFVPLAAIGDTGLLSAKAFEEGIRRYLVETEGLTTFEWRDASRYALLLDGFDELPFGHDVVQSAIESIARRFGAVLLTSRPSRIPSLGGQFCYLRLNPFTDQNIGDFLGRWFGDNEVVCNQLLDRIKATPLLSQFCRSPLMLTLYSILAGRSSIDMLPTRKTDIYGEIVSMLLGDWDAMRRVRNHFSRDLKRHALEMLAHSAHVSQRRTFSEAKLEGVCSEVLKSRQGDVRLLQDELVYRGSLIRTNPAGEYEFVHLSFQEYFAASRLARFGESRFAQQHITDDWWRASLAFYFGIVRTLDGITLPRRLKREKGLGLRLMEFLTEADYSGQSTRERVHRMLALEVLEGPDLSDTEVAVCARVGDGGIDVLLELAGRDGAQNQGNLLRILSFIASDRAISILFRRSEFLPSLSTNRLVEVLIEASRHVKSTHSIKFIVRGLEGIDSGILDSPPKSYEEAIALRCQLRRLLRTIEALVDGGQIGQTGAMRDAFAKHVELLRKNLESLLQTSLGLLCGMADGPLISTLDRALQDADVPARLLLDRVLSEFADRVGRYARGEGALQGERIVRELTTLGSHIQGGASTPADRARKLLERARSYNVQMARPSRRA